MASLILPASLRVRREPSPPHRPGEGEGREGEGGLAPGLPEPRSCSPPPSFVGSMGLCCLNIHVFRISVEHASSCDTCGNVTASCGPRTPARSPSTSRPSGGALTAARAEARIAEHHAPGHRLWMAASVCLGPSSPLALFSWLLCRDLHSLT